MQHDRSAGDPSSPSESEALGALVRGRIRTVPDWPADGVQFRDITPLLADPDTFRLLVDGLARRYEDHDIDVVACIDARGFLFGSALAYVLRASLVPVRKRGKLPFATLTQSYELEYGSAEVEVHTDAVQRGQRVLLVDDLIATGGTMLAAVALIERLGGEIFEAAAIVDLPDLGGSRRLHAAGIEVFHLCAFAGD